MVTSVPFQPPRKKVSVVWWLGGGLLLLLFISGCQLLGSNPKIRVSKQTTYISEPLRADSLPDYEEYLRQKLREGVTPENNAAVLTFQALWPSGLEPQQYEPVVKELGLDRIPSAESAMQPLGSDATRKRILDWLPKPNPDEPEREADSIVDEATFRPWTSKQVPPLAAWLDANKRPLDLLVEASRRPRYYAPSPTLLNGQHDMVINIILPGAQALRGGVRGLNLRAMHSIGENRLNDAWEDTMAIYRLSGLMAQGKTLVEQLVAISFRGIACQTTEAILSSDRVTKELAHRIQKDLATISPFANIANSVDQMERISTLDAVVYSGIHGFEALSGDGFPAGTKSAIDYISVDWNITLVHINDKYDEAVAGMRLAHFPERQKAFARFNTKLEKEAASSKQAGTILASILSRDTRSDLIGSIFAALMLPAVDAACSAEDRSNSLLTITQLSAALAVYRVEHGTYPAKIADLTPAVINKLPADLYHDKPYVYKRVNDGYLLYTIGANDRDDSGSNEQWNILEGRYIDELPVDEANQLRGKIPAGADDFSTRTPCMPFVMPKLNR